MFTWWSSSKEPENKEANDKGDNTADNEVVGQSDNVESSGETPSGKDATETAKELAKNFGSLLYNFANVASQTAVKVKDTVKDTVEGKTDILSDFSKEQEKFVNEKHNKRKDTGVPPWVGYHEEESMKSQILALSSDERNFLRDPPAGVQFHYEYDAMFPVALATLEQDPGLKKMRFNLVPKKVKETTFWRNYFYRVSLIKQSSQLTSLAASNGSSSESLTGNNKPNNEAPNSLALDEQQKSKKKTSQDNTNEDDGDMALISTSPGHEEFISDAYEGNQELSQEDLEQIGMERTSEKTTAVPTTTATTTTTTTTTTDQSSKSKSNEPSVKQPSGDVPDWEKELQEQLEEYDVVVDGGENGDDDDDDDGSWEKEIEDMLEAEQS